MSGTATLMWRTFRRAWLMMVIWLGALARFRGLFTHTFHPDEALFSSWARLIAVWRDPLLQTQMVDKPPLLFYTQALFYPLLGTPDAWVARLPNLIISLLLIPLLARLVWRLYEDEVATLVAVTMTALSPFAIQFSATAFIDPLLAGLLLASLLLVAEEKGAPGRRGPILAGLFFGLATMAKYQAWLFLPLLAGVAALHGWRRREWTRWLLGAGPLWLALVAWGGVHGGASSVWVRQLSGYGGIRPSWSWELWPRLEGWGELWLTMLGSPVLGFGLVLGLPLFLALLIHDQDWPTAVDQLFVIFLLGYMALHWFLAVPVWDRYLLPLLPAAALLLGRFASRLLAFTGPAIGLRWRTLVTGVLLGLLLLLLPQAAAARQSRFTVGGSPAADGGVAEAAPVLAQMPAGTVLYDHWFSWQWRYHLFDSGVFVSWFPHPAALVADLEVFAGSGGNRYLALPAAPAAAPVQRAVTEAGFRLRPVYATKDLTLFQVMR